MRRWPRLLRESQANKQAFDRLRQQLRPYGDRFDPAAPTLAGFPAPRCARPPRGPPPLPPEQGPWSSATK